MLGTEAYNALDKLAVNAGLTLFVLMGALMMFIVESGVIDEFSKMAALSLMIVVPGLPYCLYLLIEKFHPLNRKFHEHCIAGRRLMEQIDELEIKLVND